MLCGSLKQVSAARYFISMLLELSTKEKVKQVFTMIKEECSASDNRSSKIKYILDLLTAYFDEEIEHILRVFEVKCIIKYIVLFKG